MSNEERKQRQQDEEDLVEDLELDEKSTAKVSGGDGGGKAAKKNAEEVIKLL